MPIVQITLMPQSVEKKAEMSRVITDEINRITNIPRDAIIIAFTELSAENIASDGILLAEQLKQMK